MNWSRTFYLFVGALLVIMAAILIVGCAEPSSPDDPQPANGSFRTAEVDVNGEKVWCITWKQGYAGGISCDWNSEPSAPPTPPAIPGMG